jgi:hypothetical protein
MKRLLPCVILMTAACGATPPAKKPLKGEMQGDAAAAQVDLTSPFALACDTNARTAVYEDSLDEAFGLFCAGDKKPSGTFVKTLAGSPWDGKNELRVYRVGEPVHDNAARTTKLTGGGTVEIPVTPREYALRSHSYANDPALADAHGIKLVDGLKSDKKIDHEPENVGNGLIGKVKSRLLIEKDINHQHVVIEYEAIRTSMKMAEDVYFISTQLSKSIQGVKDLYSIGIAYSLNGKNVVTSLIMTTTDNRNQPGVAAEALLKTFREGIQNVRSNSIVMDQIKPVGFDLLGECDDVSSFEMGD